MELPLVRPYGPQLEVQYMPEVVLEMVPAVVGLLAT
jgi:hypothetical protein